MARPTGRDTLTAFTRDRRSRPVKHDRSETGGRKLIAPLAVLGVDLVVVVALLALVPVTRA